MKIALAVNPICSCFCAINAVLPHPCLFFYPSWHYAPEAPTPRVVVVVVVYADFVSSEISA